MDAGDLRNLFMKHGPAVFRRAQRLLGNKADAEEATQEVFVRVMKGADSFEGQSQVSTWLYRITTNYCLNQIRDRKRRQELFEENYAPDERAGPAPPSELVLLRRLLREADEQQARAAVCVFLDGMSHEEAAEVLGVSKGTVGNLIERFKVWAAKKTADVSKAPASGGGSYRGDPRSA